MGVCRIPFRCVFCVGTNKQAEENTMKYRFILWAGGVFFLAVFLVPAHAGENKPVIRVAGLSNYPPVMWASRDAYHGVAAELTQTVFSEMGMDVKFVVLPWKRVLEVAREGGIDVVAGLYKTDERESYLLYSIPFLEDPGVLFVRKGKIFPYHCWDDLVGKKGVVNRGYSWGEEFDSFMAKKLDIIRVNEPIQGFRLLMRSDRHADYYLYGLIPGILELKRYGISDRIDYISEPVTHEYFYFAISKASGKSSMAEPLNRILKRLIRNDYINFLVVKYTEVCSKNPPQQFGLYDVPFDEKKKNGFVPRHQAAP